MVFFMAMDTVDEAIFPHLLSFELVGVANRRSNSFCVATDTNGLGELGLGNEGVSGAWGTSSIRKDSTGMTGGGGEF